jgi:ribose transport system ATP-binding protein
MTTISTELLLEVADISKTYGAVVALRSASLAVRPGEVHALMGANGAGKSTLVKILSATVQADGGTIKVRGRPWVARTPSEARRGGIVSVYQEPSLVPDLEIGANLKLTDTPVGAFRHWVSELGIGNVDLSATARELPLATLRIIDLARALAIEPDVLMLDEMTAALPANLTERVLEVVGRQRGGERAIVFISHRLIEIAAVCDRATVLREGQTVGVVDVTAGSEERIVELMLGRIVEDLPGRLSEAAERLDRAPEVEPRLSVRGLTFDTKLQDVSFELRPGEVLGVVALEGQGQDELFDILAGSERPSGGDLLVEGNPVTFRHPADAIRAGVVYVAADRAEALLMQRSVTENIALPASSRIGGWGLIDLNAEGKRIKGAVETLQIDARAGREVQRLSGGNQQKVTIARWVAAGLRTMLCFDPTRGIDIRTKHQIYVLLRDLASEGAAILLYTSELKEVQLACDRAIVIFGGRVVGEIDATKADEATLLRAAYNLRSDAAMPEEIAAENVAAETGLGADAGPPPREPSSAPPPPGAA